MKTKSLIQFGCTAAVAVLALSTAASRADQLRTDALVLPTAIHAKINSTGCDNSDGPQITLSGSIEVSSFKSKFTFKNNRKGTRTTNCVTECDAVLIPLGGTISLPKQPSQGGVGGNPHVYLQFRDNEGENLTEEFYLGRCVQDVSVDADVLTQVAATSQIQIEGCSNRHGPDITLDSSVTLSGMHAAFIFRNDVKGTHTAETTADVMIISKDSKIVIPKRRSHGGVGRNPIISLQFLYDDDSAMCAPIVLGRCRKL